MPFAVSIMSLNRVSLLGEAVLNEATAVYLLSVVIAKFLAMTGLPESLSRVVAVNMD